MAGQNHKSDAIREQASTTRDITSSAGLMSEFNRRQQRELRFLSPFPLLTPVPLSFANARLGLGGGELGLEDFGVMQIERLEENWVAQKPLINAA